MTTKQFIALAAFLGEMRKNAEKRGKVVILSHDSLTIRPRSLCK